MSNIAGFIWYVLFNVCATKPSCFALNILMRHYFFSVLAFLRNYVLISKIFYTHTDTKQMPIFFDLREESKHIVFTVDSQR